MSGALDFKHSQNAYLFQPEQHSYHSGDDADSPPSLTSSSESPHSTSEEGGALSTSPSQLVHSQFENRKANVHAFDRLSMVDENDSTMPDTQAMSPNWDSVFGSADGSNDMMIDSNGAHSADHKQTAKQEVVENGVHTDQSSSNDLSNAPPQTTHLSDDAIFESLIQQEKFEPPFESAPQIATDAKALQANKKAVGVGAAEITPPHSAHPSASALSSRRNSLELVAELAAAAQAAQAQPRIVHTGSHFSHTSDAELPSSSHVVVNPPTESLSGLQVHVHGIAFSGAKSRVETQIRLRLELVRPVPQGEASASTTGFERVGNYDHVKLPPLTGTKRRSKKHKQMDVEAQKTLFMDAAVVRATPPHERVFVCRSCQQREKKRAQRRKSGASAKREDGDEDDQRQQNQFTLEDYQELGVDPNAPDAQAQIKRRAEEEDERRVVVFNCGDFVAFEEGACILPTRITCYCRHHREKTGFCLIFTMRDYRGNLVATGSTPPIMITDDHKSVAAAAAAAAAASNTSSAGNGQTAASSSSMRRVDGSSRSRAGSSELNAAATATDDGPQAQSRKAARRAQRSKPYGDVEERNARRSTGQNTPAVALSPSSTGDASNPDFWQTFAAITAVSGSPPASSRASTGIQTPHTEHTSPLANAPSLPPSMQMQRQQDRHEQQPQVPPQQRLPQQNMQDWAANIAAQGSISAQTLNVNPQSVPGFDLNSFLQSIQRSQQEGDQASVHQLMMLARSLPLDNAVSQTLTSTQTQTAPVPSISKLIPGEGPTSGGIEVTILGENFVEGLTCYFGDVPANSTRVWGSNTLLCILPPSASPGPVAVTVKSAGQPDTQAMERYNNSLQLFTYIDATDRALMELALQVVGLQMTGQMQSARDVAMRVVGSGPNQSMTRTHGNGNSGGARDASEALSLSSSRDSVSRSRDAVPGLFSSVQPNQSFQDSVLTFLCTLDVRGLGSFNQAIRLANKEGHTLLHLAVILGFQRLVVDLLRRKCPVNARDNNGFTPLHFAALHGRMAICKKLLAHGASIEVICEAGMDAIDVARIHDQSDIEVLLEEHQQFECQSESEESVLDDVEESLDEEDEDDVAATDDEDQSSVFDEHAEESLGREIDDAVVAALVQPSEKEKLKARETEEEGKSSEEKKKAGLKGFVSGGLDLANPFARFVMPNALTNGFPLQVPVISVFQMAMPPSFFTSHNKGGEGSSSSSTPKSSDGHLSTWRHVLEESALWINPLSSPPPPAYDTLDEPIDGTSRFPPIAVSASSSQTQSQSISALLDTEPVASSSSLTSEAASAMTSRKWRNEGKSSGSNVGGSSVATKPSLAAPNSSSSLAKTRTHLRSRSLREDRMLVYFWLPILVSVFLLVVFTKPSSVLSYDDMLSFMPF